MVRRRGNQGTQAGGIRGLSSHLHAGLLGRCPGLTPCVRSLLVSMHLRYACCACWGSLCDPSTQR